MKNSTLLKWAQNSTNNKNQSNKNGGKYYLKFTWKRFTSILYIMYFIDRSMTQKKSNFANKIKWTIFKTFTTIFIDFRVKITSQLIYLNLKRESMKKIDGSVVMAFFLGSKTTFKIKLRSVAIDMLSPLLVENDFFFFLLITYIF